jgi:hypothetical protein
MRVTLDDAIRLKKSVKELFSAEVHFHDCCGGQYFSLDATDEKLKNFIESYFSKMNLQATFTDDGLQFTVHRAK